MHMNKNTNACKVLILLYARVLKLDIISQTDFYHVIRKSQHIKEYIDTKISFIEYIFLYTHIFLLHVNATFYHSKKITSHSMIINFKA